MTVNRTYPLVSLVLLNYNGNRYLGELFKKCLYSIISTDYPNFELIFVDNRSEDDSVIYVQKLFENLEYSRKIKKLRIIINKENVIATGYNKGIKASTGDYIGLLSNDMVYDSNWLRRIIEEMEKNPQIGVAGCMILSYGTTNTIDGLGGNLGIDGRPNWPGNREIDIGQYQRIEDMDWIGGTAVIRREVLEKTGLFDSDYKIFYEDNDLCYRVRKISYRTVSVPKAKLWHKETSTIARAFANRQIAYWGERSRIRFVIIHYTLRRMLATFLVDVIWVSAVDYEWKRALIKGYWWNLMNLSYTLKRRIGYGPPHMNTCKYPIFSWGVSSYARKIVDRLKQYLVYFKR